MSILSQIAITQAQALASATLGRFDYFVDSSDELFKAYDDTNTLIVVGGSSFASGIDYTLTVPSDWDGTPANVQDALDELASRVKGIEGKTDLITVTAAIDLDDVKSKSDRALQPGDNVSELVNDANYTTAQGLPSVLAVDNTTGSNDIDVNNGQLLKAENGNAAINLRNLGVNGQISIDADGIQLNGGTFFVSAAVGNVTVSPSGNSLSLFKGDFTKIGDISIVNNDSGNVVTQTFPSYPVTSASQDGTINSGVINSVFLGGIDMIMKTNNTAYCNQLAFNTGEAFETVLKYNTPTANNNITIQDGSGTLAFLSDITPSLTFNVDLDSAESSVSRVFAGGRTTFTVTHNLGTLDIKPEVFRLSDGRTIGFRVERTGINTIDVSRNGNIADGLFRLVI